LEFEGYPENRTGYVPAPRQNQRMGGMADLVLSPNSHQLRSFFISNRSNIHESKDFPSRSPGLEEDLGSCYFELVSLSIQTLQ